MIQSERLSDAIATTWPCEPDDTLQELEPRLVASLRELEEISPEESVSARQRIIELLSVSPVLYERVEFELAWSHLASERGVSVDLAPVWTRQSEVAVAFATNRRRLTSTENLLRYSGSRSDTLAFGVVRIRIPDDHRMGRLPNPRHWKLRFSHSAAPEYTVASTAGLSEALEAVRIGTSGDDAMIFIHGYNVTFDDAALRTAQLAYDLNFSGTPIVYSWPSDGSTTAYHIDGESAAASLPSLQSLLREVTERTAGKVHVIAHSMGNRILTEALSTLSDYQLGQVIFAAPDVDAEVFRNRAMAFAGSALRYTLYVSSKDKALAISERFARYPRAGGVGSTIHAIQGIDTVDASNLDTGFLSHSYALENRSVVSDVYALIHFDQPPDLRFGMKKLETVGGHYWVFRP